MTIRRIKQVVGVVGAWSAAALLAGVLALAGLAVVAAGSGADPETAFTDPIGQRREQQTTWSPSTYDGRIDDGTRDLLEAAWHRISMHRTVVGLTEFEVVMATQDLELVQVRARARTERLIGDQSLFETEIFDATFVQQPTGWMLIHLARIAA